MSIIRKELFDVLINANHFNAQNDTIEGSINPSDYATRFNILDDVDRDTLENTLAELGYDIRGTFNEGGSLTQPDDNSVIPNITTGFRMIDTNGEEIDDEDIITANFKSGNFNVSPIADPQVPSMEWIYGYDLLGYVIKQLKSRNQYRRCIL